MPAGRKKLGEACCMRHAALRRLVRSIGSPERVQSQAEGPHLPKRNNTANSLCVEHGLPGEQFEMNKNNDDHFYFDFDEKPAAQQIIGNDNSDNDKNTMPGASSSHKGSKKLMSRPNRNDVLCGRGGAVNAHPGNVAFRRLVWKHRTTYFDSKTRKLDKAQIARDIIAHVHALPGRFLGQDGKAAAGKWVEITEQKAKKKVGQAFRDITSHDERFRIGAGLVGQSTSDDEDGDDGDDKSNQDEEYDVGGVDEKDGEAVEAAAAAAAAGYYPEDNTTAAASASAPSAASAYSLAGRKHSLDDDGDYEHNDVKKASAPTADRPTTPPLPPLPAPRMPSTLRLRRHEQQDDGGLPAHHHIVGFRPLHGAQEPNSNEEGAGYNIHVQPRQQLQQQQQQQQQHQMHQMQPPTLPHQRCDSRTRTDPSTSTMSYNTATSNIEPSTLHVQHHHEMKIRHKASRIPASEFALYPQGGDAKSAGDNDDDNNDNAGDGRHQGRRGSTESTELEKLTMEVLVERARTWEELYYSEREYSRSLEDRLVGLLGERVGRVGRQALPKRRKVGDSDALAA